MATIWTLEKVKHFIEVDSNSRCILYSTDFKNVRQKLHLRCPCGNEFYTPFTKFKDYNKRTCNECSEKLRVRSISTISYEDVVEYIESNGCKLITSKEDYISSNHPIEIIGICGHSFTAIFKEFKKRKKFKCSDCSLTKWDIAKVKEWFSRNLPNFILMSNNYNSQYDRLTVVCPHGHVFEKTWNKLLQGELCNICSLSSGAQRIYNYLINNSYEFVREYKFDDCVNEKSLPFDFAVFNGGSLLALIEFDGQQHFEPRGFGRETEEEIKRNYQEIKRNDYIKNNYCKDKGVKLIRIPYWDYENIEHILDSELRAVSKNGFNIKNKS